MSAPETAAAPAPVEEVKPTEALAATEPTPAPAAEEPKVETTVSISSIRRVVSFLSPS